MKMNLEILKTLSKYGKRKRSNAILDIILPIL